MNIAIYSRKSLFTGKGESIENQIQMCRVYIINSIDSNAHICIYEDEGYSGGNTNRPKFKEMIKDIKSGKINRVVCYKLDRIGRSVAQLSNMFELLDRYNCSFTSITEQQFDTTTPMGRAMINIASTFAQLERETIAERVRDNMLGLAKTGRWLGGQSPLGYSPEKMTYLDEEFKERTLMKLTPIDDELKIVKLVFDTYFEIHSVSQVTKKLNLSRIKGKNGGDFNSSNVVKMLRNPLYVISDEDSHDYLTQTGANVFGTPNGNGYLTYNKRKNMNIERNVNEWIVAVSKHKGIISSSEWIRIQEILDSNKDKNFIRLGTGSKNSAILSGVLKCAKCGGNMLVKHGHTEAKTGKKFSYYTCSNKYNKYVDKCTNKNIRVDRLDRNIISQLKAFNRDKLINSLQCALSKTKMENKADLNKQIQIEIDEKTKSVSNLVNTLAQAPNEDITKIIMNQIKDINNEINQLKSSLEGNSAKKSKLDSEIKNIELVIDALKNFNDNIDFIEDVNQKRLLIQAIADTIIWDGETYTAKVKIHGLNDYENEDIDKKKD
ncbi:recombinase family protein [Clostridium butyricum]|uniref:Recombinase family protein n=2 Tax=Clostridium butyricum TaxID=1492 RepID=A0A2S7FCE2_CLOBU|nr:recombinase family protein [Clostridium butyricum]KHD13962.1 hypothetical protein OA81_17640 [Clostridium butyricum]PPV15552.1 hypothetical protein AWN73_11555 [Clostridium butyricum]